MISTTNSNKLGTESFSWLDNLGEYQIRNKKPQSEAKVTIAVGLPKKNQIINSKNSFTKQNFQWWFDDHVNFNGAPLGVMPYNGLVGGFKDDYNYIFVVGNAIVSIDDKKATSFSGYYIYVNSVFNSTTDMSGSKNITFSNVGCSSSQAVEVFCSNNQSKSCEQKTASVDFNGDIDNLFFNCNKCSNDKNLENS